MKTVIHVNQHLIKANRKDAGNRPVLAVKTYKSNIYGHTARIVDRATGREMGRFVYQPDKPLSCGAQVWFETTEGVDVITAPNNQA